MIVTRGLGKSAINAGAICAYGLVKNQYSKIFPKHDENDWMQDRADFLAAQSVEEAEVLALIHSFLMTRY